MNTAEQLEQNEKYEEAYAEYKKMLVQNPENIEILTRLAHIASILERREEVKLYYAKILELDPSNILAHEQLLDIFVNEDKFKYYLIRGNLHALQQQLSYAKSDYKKAISHAKDPKEAIPARFLFAGIAESQGKLNEAIDEYLRIIDYEERNPAIFLKLAELYEKAEGVSSAIQTLESAKKEYGYSDFDEVLAGYYIRNSQPDKALAITKNELTKARALFDLGENEKGYEILTKIKSQYGNEKIFHSLTAQYYFQKDMYSEAFAEIDEYAKLDPNSALIYQMRALIYEKQGDSFNEHLNWGKYNIVRKDKDVALNEYMTAYRFKNDDIDLIETIATLLESEGDKTKASEFYERLTDINPQNANALQKLAEFRESIGDIGGALDYLEKLKAVDPRNKYLLENYDRIQNGENSGEGILSFFKNIFGSRMR